MDELYVSGSTDRTSPEAGPARFTSFFRRGKHSNMTDGPEIINSPLECQVTKDGVTVSICIYRAETEPEWILEVEDAAGGSTVWDDRFPTDRAALDEAMRTIEEDGIGCFEAGG